MSHILLTLTCYHVQQAAWNQSYKFGTDIMVYSLATDNSNFQLTVFDSVREEEKTGKKKKKETKEEGFSVV